MSRSEFRYNKKRKHYSYLFKDVGSKCKNIVLTSKPFRKDHRTIRKNLRLFKHPNPNSEKQAYVIPIIYFDDLCSFDYRTLKWCFNPNDKRKIKRIKRHRKAQKKSASKSRQ